ncbi:MAG TPA: DUF2480 family protein [Bacteroidia bacterium]|jgi:hypothetical protein|nr:DUF2480 family protein [Bacteroidia bacterium]
MEEIVNKVEQSGLITIDPGELYLPGERVTLDIKDQLFQGLILKEKDFREYIKTNDWSLYKDKYVALTCSADAIIPDWTWMLLASALQPFAKKIVFGNAELLETVLFEEALKNFDTEKFRDARIVIKGCGDKPVPKTAYVELTRLLQPVAKSIMYGEPCSTVPVYKQPKK